MTIGSVAHLDIEWIDMVFNTSGPATGYEERGLKERSVGCRTICAVDGKRQPGFPEVVYNASASVAHLVGNSWSSLVWGMPLLFAILGVQANY
jgi:hypothetical protein